MTLTGVVKSCSQDRGEGLVEVEIVGANQLGNHVTGTVRMVLPRSK
jgi:hypothetical protein